MADTDANEWLNSLVDEVAPDETEEAAVEPEQAAAEPEQTEEIEAAEAAEAEETVEDEEEKPRTVPLAELVAERKKRQEMEARLRDTETKMAKYEALWEKLEGQEEEKKPEEEIPEYDYDPTGHLKAKLEQTEKKVEQTEAEIRQQQELSQLQSRLQASEASFVEQHPDYYEALNFVRTMQKNNLTPIAKAQNWSEAQLQQAIAMQELQGATQLLAQGIDPAQYVYEVATANGYTPQTRQEDDMDKMEKKLAAAKSGNTGTTPKEKKLSREQVDNMSIPEFEEAMAEMFGPRH